MARYHMKKDGTPGVCNAQPGNCPLGGNENHVEANSPEEAQRQFDSKNEKIAELKDSLRHDFDSYNDEEKAVFSNMSMEDHDTYYIDFDKLPESAQEKVTAITGTFDLSDENIMVIHKDLYASASWAIESRDEEDPIGDLEKALNDEDKTYLDIKYLDDPEVPQEYKDLLNEYIDDYVDGEWYDFTKVPIDGGRGYLLVEGDFSDQA